MPNYKKAINESIVGALSIVSQGMIDDGIDGYILNSDLNYIYIKIVKGFEKLSTLCTNVMQNFHINFHINQTPYQLQIQALDFLVKHDLFKMLINNPLYSTLDSTMNQESSHTQNELR